MPGWLTNVDYGMLIYRERVQTNGKSVCGPSMEAYRLKSNTQSSCCGGDVGRQVFRNLYGEDNHLNNDVRDTIVPRLRVPRGGYQH